MSTAGLWAFQAPAPGYSEVIVCHSEWYFLETVKMCLVTDDYFFRINLWCNSLSKLVTLVKYSCHQRVLYINKYFWEIILWVSPYCDRQYEERMLCMNGNVTDIAVAWGHLCTNRQLSLLSCYSISCYSCTVANSGLHSWLSPDIHIRAIRL